MSLELTLQNQVFDSNPPTPKNELERLFALGELDLDYYDLDKSLADLTQLAAKVAGTSISLVNIIDSYTQWSVSSFGIDVKQMEREESVCQYTILEKNDSGFEVKDLASDERFMDKFYVIDSPHLKYYFGVPLKLREDLSLGALCVMHEDEKHLSAEKKAMLEIIAKEVVNRIKIHHVVSNLKQKIEESTTIKNRVAHDIRGPIGGIIGLAEIIQMQGNDNKLEEVLDFINLIQRSGKSVLELADEILSTRFESHSNEPTPPKDSEFTMVTLKERVLDMFSPQAISKNVQLVVECSRMMEKVPFSKNKILQILGNLISNSIKFTPEGGKVQVKMDVLILDQNKVLTLIVKDSGVGISPEKISEILQGGTATSSGTSGEKGYGFGLNLVHHLIQSLKGKMDLKSEPGQGAEFELTLPVS